MKVRLLASACVLAALGVAVAPAHATPYAGQFRYLSTGTIAMQGADGARWLLAIGATKGGVETRAEQNLYIDLSRCAASTCIVKGRWRRPLTEAEISIGGDFSYAAKTDPPPATATLKSVLGGFNLDLQLLGDKVNGGGFDPFRSTTPPGVGARSYQETPAGGTLRLRGVSCHFSVSGAVIGETTLIDSLGDDARDARTAPPATLPAGFLTGKHAVRC